MLQFLEFTEAHVLSVTNRVEKHGDEEVPAVSLALKMTVPNTVLDLIDPKLREALFKAVDDQEDLPGVEKSTPVLRCNSIERVTLPTKYEGWVLQVDDGIDETTPMAFGSVKVDKMSTEPLQGGSSILYLRAGTSDVDADKLGKLAMHNGQSIWITLTAPKAGAAPIDGTAEAFQRDHPDATDLFAQTHGDGGAPAEGDEADSEGGETDAGDGNWPFPRNASTESPPQSVTTEQSKRRRGARTSKEALAGASGLSD